MAQNQPLDFKSVTETEGYDSCYEEPIEMEPSMDRQLPEFQIPTRNFDHLAYGDFDRSPTVGCVGCMPRRRPAPLRNSLTYGGTAELSVLTGLSQKEVHALHARFRKIAPKGFMTRDQFKHTLGMLGMTPNDYIPNRMFSVFDSNGDGVLTFSEYLESFAVLLRGTEEERMQLSFKLADTSGLGRVTLADFKALIEACQSTSTSLLENQRLISDQEVYQLFNDIAKDKSFISLDSYTEGVKSNAKFLTILGLGGGGVRAPGRRGVSPMSPSTPEPKRANSAQQLRIEIEKLKSELVNSASSNAAASLIADRLEMILTRSAAKKGDETPELRSDDGRPSSPPTSGGGVNKGHSQENLGAPAEAPSSISSGPARTQTNVPKKGHRLLGPKKGLAVHFGHENWNMVLSMMLGIRLAVGRAGYEINRPLTSIDFAVKDKFSIVPQLSNFLDSKISSKVRVTRFIDYAPLVFRKLREEISGISEEEYMRSVGPEQLLGNMVLGNLSSLAELTTEGKGGAFFYYTADGRFMIKTVCKEEKRLLKQILREYYEHLSRNKYSFIVRFYGLHGLRVKRNPVMFQRGKYRDDEKIFFVVMGNLFNTPLEVHRRFDLKGSWINRSVGPQVTDTSVALKDNDFVERKEVVNVGPETKTIICEQLRRDCEFFAQHNILDYSLLLGIHDRQHASSPVPSLDGAAETGEARSFPSQDGSAVYYIGIIDILCQWDTKKRVENFFKSIRYDGRGISAVPPQEYADRFNAFLADHIV